MTGLQLRAFRLSPFLQIGVTNVSLGSLGTVSVKIVRIRIWVKGSAVTIVKVIVNHSKQ